jgi:hypothetical protein
MERVATVPARCRSRMRALCSFWDDFYSLGNRLDPRAKFLRFGRSAVPNAISFRGKRGTIVLGRPGVPGRLPIDRGYHIDRKKAFHVENRSCV